MMKHSNRYLEAKRMSVSTAQSVDETTLNRFTLIRWLRSFSFFPKEHHEEEAVVAALQEWFAVQQNGLNEVKLPFVGFITQGPLRATPYFPTGNQDSVIQISPITFAMRNIAKAENSCFWPESQVGNPPTMRMSKRSPAEMLFISAGVKI